MKWRLAAILCAIALLIPMKVVEGFFVPQPGGGEPDPDFLRVCRWVRMNTPKDDLFLIPLTEEGFRLYAKRPVVVVNKDLAMAMYDQGAGAELWRRFQDVRTMPAWVVAEKYGARFILTWHYKMDLPIACQRGDWRLYRAR